MTARRDEPENELSEATFMCHDKPGVVSGRCEPTTICAGYTLAKYATHDEILKMLGGASVALAEIPEPKDA